MSETSPLHKTLASIKEMVQKPEKNAPHVFTEADNDNVLILTDIVKKGKNIPSKPSSPKQKQERISEVQKLLASIQDTSQEITADINKDGKFDSFIQEKLSEAIQEWVNTHLPELIHTALSQKDTHNDEASKNETA